MSPSMHAYSDNGLIVSRRWGELTYSSKFQQEEFHGNYSVELQVEHLDGLWTIILQVDRNDEFQ